MKKITLLLIITLFLLTACQALVQQHDILGVTDVIVCPGQGMTNYAKPPQINKEHIFCGEISGHRAKGFHSRPEGHNPATVSDFTISQEPNASGIYGGRFKLTIHGEGQKKFSTMFPDSCSQDEVLNSILYAASNSMACPVGAPVWASCGLSHADPIFKNTGPYCMGDNAKPFTIAFAVTKAGDINTAFPLYFPDND